MTNPHETYCNETATHFVAVRGRGQQRTRKDCATMDDANAYAATYEAKQEARRARLEAASDHASERANSAYRKTAIAAERQ